MTPSHPDQRRTILALDCAGWACSAAVWGEGRVLARRFEVLRRGHAERLMPMVEAVMAEAALSYEALDSLAVTRGPGGFTGVRIGLATARALALAAGRPLAGFDNFAVLAAAVPAARWAGRPLAVLIDAKRAELFVQLFTAPGRPVGPPEALSPAEIAARLPAGAVLLAGDAVAQVLPALEGRAGTVEAVAEAGHADAAVLAGLAARAPLPAAAPLPEALYLRAPDVSLPKGRPG